MLPVLTDLGLDGAAVIVTGGGSGIVASTARQLGAVGARVALVGRCGASLKEVAAQIAEGGGEALCVTAGLADPASPHRIVDACVAHNGQINGLVNNAAVVRHMPLRDWDVGRFDEHVATNLRAPFFLIQAALPALLDSRVRSVVNVSSSPGTLRRVGRAVYGMTKCALDYLTQTLAGELAPPGVRVNSIAPGPIDTPHTRDLGRRPGRGLPVAGQPGPARPDRGPGGGGVLDRAAAEPAGLVDDGSGHPPGRGPGH